MYAARPPGVKQIRPGDSVLARTPILDGDHVHAEPGEQGTVIGLPDGLVTVFWLRTETICDCDADEELESVPDSWSVEGVL